MFFMLDSSDTSCEEDLVQTLRARRKIIREKSEVLSLPDSKFVKYFCLNKEAFKYVAEKVEPFMKDKIRSTSISNTLKLAATLLFLTQGSYQSDLENEFNLGLSQSAVSKSLEETLDVLESVICPLYLEFEGNTNKENETKLGFFNVAKFPGVIGCIDGMHIKILAPKKDEQHLYINSKGYFSLNALIICDHKMRIRYIDAQNPGSYDDSKVWSKSKAKQILHQRYKSGERNFWLLGDSDYPLERYLMTPYRSVAEESPSFTYNRKHEQTRNIIDTTIELLKNRFRCLLGTRELHYKPAKAAKIANVCAALHNLCIEFESDPAYTHKRTNIYQHNMNIFKSSQNIGADAMREQIKKSFCKKKGIISFFQDS